MKNFLAARLPFVMISGSIWAVGKQEETSADPVEIEIFYPAADDAL